MREDLRVAVRSLKKSPGFTAVALSILALGIGAATAIFSIVDAVVLRGLPFDEHDRIVAVLERDTLRPTTFGGGTTTPQTYLDWRRLHTSFEAIAAVSNAAFFLRNERGEPDLAPAQRVTPEFFTVLRVAPLLGRRFTAADEVDEQRRVLILSYGAWQRRFGGSPDVVGRTIDLAPPGTGLREERWEVVGVMPPGFSYPVAPERPTDFYVPLAVRNEDRIRAKSRNYGWLAIARLRDDVTIAQADGDMNQLMAALDAEYPQWSPGGRARVVTLHEHLIGRVRSWMLVLLGAVGLVLLMACANVANLMLARGLTRSHETGVKAALGASRWRLARSMLVEGLVLALAGAMLGVLLALAGSQLAKAWLPADVPRVADIAIDLRVLGAAVAAALMTGAIFGLVPALQSSRPDLTSALKESGRTTAAATGSRLRSALIVAEVAIAVVLLVGAGLFIGSFMRVMRVDIGFDYTNLLTLNASAYPAGTNVTREQRLLGLERMLEAVRRIDGIDIAGAVSGGLPLSGNWSRGRATLPGRGPLTDADDAIDRRTVTSGYLHALGIPLLRGRLISDDDHEGSPMTVVINQAAARRYWPGQDALGQRLIIDGADRTVVGIVGDVRHLGPEAPARQEAYIPARQDRLDPKFPGTGGVPATLVMRTTRDPLSLLPAVKAAIWSFNPQQRFSPEIFTVEAYMGRLIAQRRFNMALLTLFGALGVLIAAAGIYGVMAYIVAQRTSEIGIRMALGGTPAGMIALVLRHASLLMGAGLVIGTLGAWYLATLAENFLFEIDARDARIFALALLTLSLAGLLASAVPARRASTVDPLVALGRHR